MRQLYIELDETYIMAKKIRRKRGAVAEAKAVAAKLTPRDKKTMGSIVGLADGVVVAAEKRQRSARRYSVAHAFERPLQPAEADPRNGQRTNRRQLFDLSQAKAYMRTMLVASGCKKLLTQGKTTSLRGMFYMLKHTIEGTKENTFDDQSECDTIIEDVEVLLGQPPRRAAPVRRQARRDGRQHHRSPTAATRSIARGWAPAATRFPRSSSRK